MDKRFMVKWTDSKGRYHEKYYKDDATSKRVYARKMNEKTLTTVYCERCYYFVGDDVDADEIDTDYTIDLFVRRTFAGFPLPQYEKAIANGKQYI